MRLSSREHLSEALEALKREHGEWTYDIPLPNGVWTRGNEGLPHTRLRRIIQTINDLSRKPLSQSRVLDLGCLDGIFSIELALQGADTVGVEIREANVRKAEFCKNALGLDNLEFRKDDVRNILEETYGKFDAIVCSGILYHLSAPDAIDLIRQMYRLATRIVVIDTHIALRSIERITHEDSEYWGRTVREHPKDATPEQIEKEKLASADGKPSFHFTRPSLVNILSDTGFTSVYECFVPAHLNFGKPGLEHRNRCTFVALKDGPCRIETSPALNALEERWPEGSLTYAAERTSRT